MKILRLIQSLTITREFPVNLSKDDEWIFNKLLTAHIEDIKIVQLHNVHVIAQGGIFKGLRAIKSLTLANDNGQIVSYSPLSILKIIIFWPGVQLKKYSEYILIDNVYSHTYYHWLTEALPRLFLVKDQLQSSTLLLPANHDLKFHQETLQLFKVEKIERLQKHVRYRVPNLLTSTQIGRVANYHPAVIKQMVAYIKSAIGPSVGLGEKIYVSRRRALRRKVLNETDLEISLALFGFKVIVFEDYSFAEQVNIMRECRYLISIHGAGLTNMIFMESGSKIMELRLNDHGENYFFYALATTVNLKYYYQFCEPVNSDSVQDADIIVDTEEFQKNIKWMLS